MSVVVCTIDVGTTRTKAALVASDGAIVALASELTPAAPKQELAVDTEALLAVVVELLAALRKACPDARVEALCVTNQRATVLALDGARRPLASLSWQDPGVEDARAALAERISEDAFRDLTGLPHSTIWALTKIHWWRTHASELTERTDRYALVHDDLLCRLGAEEALIDPSNASPTGLWDLRRQRWSPALLELVALRPEQLPRVVPAGTIAGRLPSELARQTGLAEGTPLVVGGGDQACAALGLAVLGPGQVALSLGTAADVLSPLAGVPEPHPARIVTDHLVEGQTMLEGFLGAFGVSLDWMRSLAPDTADAGELSLSEDTPLFFPFLNGIASPDFEPTVRGGFEGLDPTHDAAALALAVRDGLAMELRRILESPATADGVKELVVAGGGATDAGLLHHIADVCGVRLVSRRGREATLIGAAAVAQVAVGGFDSSVSAARSFTHEDTARWEPGERTELLTRRYSRYCERVNALLARRRQA